MLQARHAKHVHHFTHHTAKKIGVRIYRFANVGNYIHLLIKVPSRAIWQRFLRELAGGIAIIITGAKKGSALLKNKSQRGFWDELAFTRIVSFGRDFKTLCTYVVKNLFEAIGIPRDQLIPLQLLSIHEDG